MHNQPLRCRRAARCTAIQQSDARRKHLLIGSYLISIAITALWLAQVPQSSRSPRDSSKFVPPHLTMNSVNRLDKGDRLSRSAGAGLDAR